MEINRFMKTNNINTNKKSDMIYTIIIVGLLIAFITVTMYFAYDSNNC